MKKYAFTLAELLVSILVISFILTLLAPVITKKIKDGSITINSGSTINSRLFIYDKSNSDCSEISGSTNTLKCNFKVPTNVNKINALLVSAGGGGAGATQPSIEYGKKLTVANTTAKTSKTQELTITNGMSNVTVSELIGSGAGGGGASWAESSGGPQSQSDCDPFNALYIPAAYNGTGGKNLCVTKYNVGDTNGPTIASSVTTVYADGATCSANECCWKGTTASPCTASGSWSGHTTSYSGCNRTACNWYAANSSCQAWAPGGTKAGDWRLPTSNEMEGWANNISKVSTYLGSDGLQLCDNSSSSYGSVRCDFYNSRCYGAYADYCYPYFVWSATPDGGGYYYYYLINGSLYGPNNDYPRYANSARCVLESGLGSNTALSGGGGGAGAYIKNYQIPNDIISSNIGGKIVLYAAAGGSGGNSASSSGSSASNGSNGNTSYIEIYNKDNVLKWGIRAFGGNAGYGATSTLAGSGGAKKSTNSCQLYENGAWKSISCTGTGFAGSSGEAGGAGGGSMYNTTVAQGGGNGGTSTGANGYNGTVYGAGGGGATVTFDSSNNATRGTGGSGANGVAEITYTYTHQAAAGGGGGGGAFAYIKNIPVVSENTYTITVGAGGLGGTISSNGSDGGESSINAGGTIYTLTGGKGGKAGTSATSSSTVVQGTGGLAGVVSANVTSAAGAEYKNGENGENGGTFTQDDIHANSLPYGGSFGGLGGMSGIDTKGGCGGLFIDSSICTNNTVNGTNTTFTTPTISNGNIDYAQAGAGGGGGGWSENTSLYPSPGSGAQGQGGYVLLMWEK